MANNAPRSLKVRKSLFAVLLVVIVIATVYMLLPRGPWMVPEEAKRLPNPLQSSPASLQSAQTIYRDKCANCHGISGKGDGHDTSSHHPAPTDFTDARHMSTETDGELFYKLSEGRRPMPPFKKRLTEEQRWQMILLLRSFAGTHGESVANPVQRGSPARFATLSRLAAGVSINFGSLRQSKN